MNIRGLWEYDKTLDLLAREQNVSRELQRSLEKEIRGRYRVEGELEQKKRLLEDKNRKIKKLQDAWEAAQEALRCSRKACNSLEQENKELRKQSDVDAMTAINLQEELETAKQRIEELESEKDIRATFIPEMNSWIPLEGPVCECARRFPVPALILNSNEKIVTGE